MNTNIINCFKNRINKIFDERRGFSTNKNIIVFESDDWGSIRMPSKEIYDLGIKKGYLFNETLYDRFDSLESDDDLTALFETLYKYRNNNDEHPIFTANTLVANPDFNKIEDSYFEKYYYETVDKTFASYPNHSNSLKLWYQGQENKIFKLQYHGREHLNVKCYMLDLRKKKEDLLFCFNNRILGAINKNENKPINKYVYATKPIDKNDNQEIIKILEDGIKLFTKLHGFNSVSFIYPNYILNPEYEYKLHRLGVIIFQGDYIQRVPYNCSLKNVYHYLGEKNKIGQIYLVRNCSFEPTLEPGIDTVGKCLIQIEKAFKFNKPAIISTHRVNYIGFIDESNRKNNIEKLDKLLSIILKKWPDVEFMSSDKLGELIINEQVK